MDSLKKSQFQMQQSTKSILAFYVKEDERTIRPIHKSRIESQNGQNGIFITRFHDPKQDLVFMTLHQSEGLLFHHHYQVRFQVNARITLIWVNG